jgi:class 3 adenylate cyclase/tetratricopeptide (TPR) repeat protein
MEGIKMKCPKCQFENPDDSKFCFECGHKFELRCPHCDKALPINVKFCNECGHDLRIPSETPPKDLSFDEKLTKIQRYLPKGLTEKILSQKDRIEGERKQVTVMFADMEGFTQLSERLGPEEAYTVMDQVYEILIHKVHNYEGTVNEFTGDGIMALFGAPIALEDAPQRAIRSAYAIHREMTRFSDKMKQEKENIPALKMRIGIHTGPVVVGTLGNDLRVEFKAVGDTVNLASRMEGLAEPGSTYVTEDTFRLTEGLFRFEVLGEHAVKGRADTVKIYRVIAPSTRRTRFDVSAERGLTPFVGRERELELLLDGFERAKEGRGQAFSIVSEAGVGKSRLLYEFRKAVINENATFLEGKCLSYSKNVTYHPVIDTLKSNFDIKEGDADFEIKEKVINGLKVLGVDEASTLPYILELLSVKDSGIDKIPMSPEAKRDRITEAVKRITLKGSVIRPLIVATEDLHWIDKSSEDYLKHLLDSIAGARIFLIFTYRPEFVHTWGAKSYHSQVNLNRLSNRESLAMVSYLLSTEVLPKDLAELILEKTEGIPFYIEEFIKSLTQLKLIEKKDGQIQLTKDIQKVTIPATIQDVIMARVDALPEGVKKVLQIGSVIGREFDYELMRLTTGLSEQVLLSNLSVLKDSELLYERGIYPESTYIFKHALTQEVIYDSILTIRKTILHQEVGNAIEEIYKNIISEFYGLLAKHFIEAENYEKGDIYSKSAAKKALNAASFKEAIDHTKKSIFCLECLPRTDTLQRKIIDARAVLAGYHINLSHIARANEAVAPIADLAIKLNYQKRLPAIYLAIGLHNLTSELDVSKGLRYLNEVLKISEQVKDYISLWLTSINLGWYLSWNCEFEKSLHYLKKSLDLSIAANNLMGIAFLKSLISAHNYVIQGDIGLAYQTTQETLQLEEESDDILVKAFTFSSHGSSCYFKGLFDEAGKYLLNGLAFCEKTMHFAWGGWTAGWLGYMYSDMGAYEKAQDYFEKAISISESSKLYPSLIKMWKVSIARAKVLNHVIDINLGGLFEHYEKNKLKFCEGLMGRYIGEILLNIDVQYMSEAQDWIKKAIEVDQRNGVRWQLGRDYALYAELYKRKGDLPKAKENLSKAIEIFKECGADGWVEKYEKELATL